MPASPEREEMKRALAARGQAEALSMTATASSINLVPFAQVFSPARTNQLSLIAQIHVSPSPLAQRPPANCTDFVPAILVTPCR